MKLLPILLPLVALPLRVRSGMSMPEEMPPSASPGDAKDEPDWRSAYLRLREQEPAELEPLPPVLPALARNAHDPESEVTEVRSVTATPTTERLEKMRLLAEPSPAAIPVGRSWLVDLPAASGPAWQLHVEQAQPQAPLNLELRVPQVIQTQARQQLSDLDKRLRDAGHDVLRSRLRDGARTDPRRRSVDEVES